MAISKIKGSAIQDATIPEDKLEDEAGSFRMILDASDGSATDAGDFLLLDATASSTNVGEQFLFEPATDDGSVVLNNVNITGSVLQVKTAVDTALRTTTSATFDIASNTAQVTITPSSSGSKFLITCCGVASCNDGNDGWYTTIFRDSTNLGNSTTGLAHGVSVAGVQIHFHPFSMTVLDSPSTASAITYGLQFRSYNHDSDGSLTTRIGQHLAGTSNPVPTHIVVMEIAG
jgi:hypothetical protein